MAIHRVHHGRRGWHWVGVSPHVEHRRRLRVLGIVALLSRERSVDIVGFLSETFVSGFFLVTPAFISV